MKQAHGTDGGLGEAEAGGAPLSGGIRDQLKSCSDCLAQPSRSQRSLGNSKLSLTYRFFPPAINFVFPV